MTEPHAAASALGWISTVVLARDILGSKAKGLGRAGRDWCVANNVRYERRGKFLFVRIADVRAVLEPTERGPRTIPPIKETPIKKTG